MKREHLYPNGHVEVGTGRPGYRWTPAYSAVTSCGFTIPLTRRHWQDIARRDGHKLVFHSDADAARDAFLLEAMAAVD